LNEYANSYKDLMSAIREASLSIDSATTNFASTSEESAATLEQLSASVDTLLQQNNLVVTKIKETDQAIKGMVQLA
jgi:methyl-accepting chemotaxis protein